MTNIDQILSFITGPIFAINISSYYYYSYKIQTKVTPSQQLGGTLEIYIKMLYSSH